MSRLPVLLSILFCLFVTQSVKAQEMDEQMINAQLRYIKEKSDLTRREYQRFALIYMEYNKALYELNKSLIPQNNDGNGLFSNMPLGIRLNEQSEEYYEKWNQINKTYREKLEKQLPDSTRQKIGIAQWELGQRIWKEWAEKSQKTQERQMGMIRMIDQGDWRPGGFQPQMQGQQRSFEDINKYLQDHPEERKRFEEQHEYWQDHPEEFEQFHEQMEQQRKQNEERWKEMADQQKQWWENYWDEWNRNGQFRRNSPIFSDPRQQRIFPPRRDSDSVRNNWQHNLPQPNVGAPGPTWNGPSQWNNRFWDTPRYEP